MNPYPTPSTVSVFVKLVLTSKCDWVVSRVRVIDRISKRAMEKNSMDLGENV
jgi:hypothetical protein